MPSLTPSSGRRRRVDFLENKDAIAPHSPPRDYPRASLLIWLHRLRVLARLPRKST